MKIKKPKKPLSEAQLAQRRAASLKAREKATGPRTEKGKAIVSQNSHKTGEFAKSVRASIVGKPCKSTCHKFETCAFILANKTKPGGKCLDVADWNIIEESGEAILAAQKGDTEKMNKLASTLLGMNVAVIGQMFGDIQERGIWKTEDIIGKEGEVIGQRLIANPMIGMMMKGIEKQGISFTEFLATPASQAKLDNDKESQQTAAEFTRQISRLVPSVMDVPDFDDSEIMDADIVSEEGNEKPCG